MLWSGVIVLGLSENESYADMAYQNDVALGAKVTHLSDAEAIRASFISKVPTAAFEGHTGYLNMEGGWADAGQGIAIMIERVISLGGKVLPGKRVNRISQNNGGKTNGVECEDGTFYEAATVVIATGSWTTSTFPNVAAKHSTGLSTGEEEAKLYKEVPVVLDFRTGFYIFPPTDKGVIKMAMHLAGYTHTKGGISTPRTITDSPTSGLAIPKCNVRELRTQLGNVYPELAQKPFSATRLCWYNDSPDGDWIIGRVPGDPSLILATAGSGHAYKFLPVIGRLVADTIDGTIKPDLAAKFSIERSYTGADGSRPGIPLAELDIDQLCTPQDLHAE
ncbi:hypothetical protein C0991_011717 [Blastosporella zonata]|nr:hypothetical protein C0991_011717 [Blastosporella zonata]